MSFEPTSPDTALRLLVALAIGLLVGAERGWKTRDLEEGQRLAGLRTFGLIGLLGGLTGLLGLDLGPVPVGLALLGVAILLGVAYTRATSPEPDSGVGITTVVALLLTFALGVQATLGDLALAAAAAVIATLLLGMKATLHDWLAQVEERELTALLRLLLISVVILPFLPDRGFGPWQALNPRALWWMVVLISAISFAGYVAVKLLGQRRGLALTALFSGLASSTALTIQFARLGRQQPEAGVLLSSCILFGCAAMVPRMLLVVLALHPGLAWSLLPELTAMAAAILFPALYWWLRADRTQHPDGISLSNPVELKFALGFGAVLALVTLLITGTRELLGEQALLGVAVISGVVNVDAVTISLSRMSHAGVPGSTALTGIVLAAATNNLAKAVIATSIGGSATGWRVAAPLTAATVAAVAVLALR